ncbi:Kinase interacting (KIP1-like) family protein [Rhynchospora pubera]|uniref:Kinase interacting (KIP1-like) family protein n=1 Tax=Rhynchospora pubera TaxID=906938 RepID=A0AAV8DB93_9POAL|nr:Kinase interacting (KIP1-like) family protein [Rhynchospora pubera]
MLQRAASNAYSWWWASRIRTNQSKWLDGNLQEMNERVSVILKLLGEEADSFAKRAEMYYKRRPEVINNVEEAYRAYRALAERYDHVSGELHKANHTIAAAFPEQVQYAMLEADDEDDSEHAPKAITPIDPTKIRKSTVEGLLKKKKRDKEKGKRTPKSDLKITIEKAQAEIDRLQKAILVLQTEKEFVKSSYESGIAKYWEIEKQMAEMQEEVCSLQDQSGAAGTVIEDGEARALMAATALKSCEEAIVRLKEQQQESADQARVESERIQLAIEKLNSIKGESGEPAQSQQLTEPIKIFDDPAGIQVEKQDQLDVICEKVKKHFEMNPETSVNEIADKIDELVCKVIELEMKVSSLNAQINHLSNENEELEKCLKKLEEEKTGLSDDSNELNRRLKEAEQELKRVKELEDGVKEEERALASGFSGVVSSLRNISKKFDDGEGNETKENSIDTMVHSTQSEIAEEMNSSEEKDQRVGPTGVPTIVDAAFSSVHGAEDVKEIVEIHETNTEVVKDQTVENLQDATLNLIKEEKIEERKSNEDVLLVLEHGSAKTMNEGNQEVPDKKDSKVTMYEGEISSQNSEIFEKGSSKAAKNKYRRGISLEQGEKQYAPLAETVPNFRGEEKDGGLSWQELLLDGLEGREKILLADYTAILRSYKETTRRLSEVEKRNQEQFSEMARVVQELRKNNALKDEEIRSLKQFLRSFKMTSSDVTSDGSSALLENEILERRSDSSIEEKLRVDIDSMFEENFKYMLRISASLNRTQEFEAKYKKLESELKKPKGENVEDSKKGSNTNTKPETTEKRLRDLKTELEVWLEQITLLKQELQGRVSSLTGMRDEISEAVRGSTATDGSRLSVFQGEVLGLQLENDKAEMELRAGVDLVSSLHIKVDSDLSKIKESFELPSSESERKTKLEHFKQHPSKSRVPLRNFLFGQKPKPKKKPSFFDCINPIFQKHNSDLKGGYVGMQNN